MINHRNEQISKFFGIFFALITLTVFLFIIIGNLLNPKGDQAVVL